MILNICLKKNSDEILVVLCYLHHSDLSSSVTPEQFRRLLHLDDMVTSAPQRLEVIEVSALTGQGLDDVVRWLGASAKG